VTAAATDARYFDIELPAGATFDEALPPGHAAFVVAHDGVVSIGGHEVTGVGLAHLGDGDAVRLTAVGGPAKALLIAGGRLRSRWPGTVPS